MLKLRCLGTLEIAGQGDLGVSAGQVRRLALLAVLAVERDRAVSRDQLMALLWPESDGRRARQSLSQAIYGLRRNLGEPDLILGQRKLRLERGADRDRYQPFFGCSRGR
ncbi:MAG: winged helix-turn-helix domain-containing protein [Gemmatimonadaceae bacterium]|nr:winged helix-turn-helix domain-containing protein [Gemmatimonadaceae bacterium]